MTIEYLYSWTSYSDTGQKQTVEDGKVIDVCSIPREEAKEMYYKTRSKEMQAYDSDREAAAGRECQELDRRNKR